MSVQRRTFALHLAMTPGIGGRTVTRILARNELLNRSSEDFLKFTEELLREEYKLSQKAAASLKGSSLEATLALEDKLSRLGVELVTAADAHYPAVVEEFDPDPPGVLFLYGNTRLLESKTFSVMSSRGSLPADLEEIERRAEEGVLNGEVLVTGHDRPEYQRSAVVPLRWGAPRLLCLDRGLFKVLGEDLKDEAFRAARLWRYQYDPTMDLAVSPFRPSADFIGVNNQVRDRLVASLSRRLDFVNVSPDGGMMKLAKQALKVGRPVRVSDRSVVYRQLESAGAQVLA